MRIDGDEPRYLGTRQAVLKAWFGRDMTTMTEIDLHGRCVGLSASSSEFASLNRTIGVNFRIR